MRIAVVHSFYSSGVPSGENAVVLEQLDALTAAGHDVALVSRHTDSESRRTFYRMRTAAQVITGHGPDPTSELLHFRPDIVHVHNLFPNFGTRWLRSWRGPLVATMHNYRPFCANGLLFRDGHPCIECPSRSWTSAIRHACYHQSRVATLPIALRNARGPEKDAVLARADALLCLSDEAAQTFREFAGARLPIVVVPNGVDLHPSVSGNSPNGRWLVVSRLTAEKGVRELVTVWPAGESLDIIGSGPDEDLIRTMNRPGVHLLGRLPRDAIIAAMPAYTGLMFPSRCAEMQPTVVLEAMACGLPIVALETSVGAVMGGDGAAVYDDDVTLQVAIQQVAADRERMSGVVRQRYLDTYTRDAWYARVMAVYHSAIQSAALS